MAPVQFQRNPFNLGRPAVESEARVLNPRARLFFAARGPARVGESCGHESGARVTLVMQHPSDSPVPVEPEIETEHAGEFVAELRRLSDALPERINVDAQSVEQGLAKLVLTLIELIRRLLEKQAVRRMEGGDLTPEQIEELGLALMKLEEKMRELKGQFGLEDEDLNLDLGPVGRLI